MSAGYKRQVADCARRTSTDELSDAALMLLLEMHFLILTTAGESCHTVPYDLDFYF